MLILESYTYHSQQTTLKTSLHYLLPLNSIKIIFKKSFLYKDSQWQVKKLEYLFVSYD